jgi:hypothetical protein
MSPWTKITETLRWSPAYLQQQLTRRRPAGNPLNLIIAVADHFEPSIVPDGKGGFAPRDVQQQRLERWHREYPRANGDWRDAEGRPLVHTYFYPAEQYDTELVESIAQFCHAGWGELEVQLHHGVDVPDTSANTRRQLEAFRDALVRHGCLSRWDGAGAARYAFVHGNWALANSARGRNCGVDDEIQILAETGCYADFTLPSAPNPSQVTKINALYECGLPLAERAPHRRGRDLEAGRAPSIFPLIVQGPLMLDWGRRKLGFFPGIENSEISGRNRPTHARLRLWLQASIAVRGRPDWVFVKLHCHGMDPRDESAMIGPVREQFLREWNEYARETGTQLHFTTAREMVNILLAACDGREGNPGDFRDYKLRLIRPHQAA